MSIGDIKIDKRENERVLVVHEYDRVASDFRIDCLDGKTVLELNKDFEDSPVVDVVFINKLQKIDPAWKYKSIDNIISLCDSIGIKKYKYPKDRLEKTKESLVDEWIELDIAGVSNPVNNNSGCYAVKFKNRIDNITKYFKRDYKINEQISEFEGVLYALTEIKKKHIEIQNIHIRISRPETVRKLNRSCNIKNPVTEKIMNKIKNQERDFNNVSYEIVSRNDNKNLIETAVKKYKTKHRANAQS